MPAQTLRPYQEAALASVMSAYRDGARSVLMVLPTGGGKTTVFGSLVAQLSGGGHRSLVLVHRRELADQACNRLREFGVDHGVIMAGHQPAPYRRVQVASVQTLSRRAAPEARLVVCDEAHLSTATTWANILEQYPSARILGVTATPWRLSGKPLAGAYDACVVAATPRELREQGFLCDYVGFSYLTPDLGDVRTTAGEYNEADSAAAMGQSLIVDNIVEEWLKHASALSTVVFAVTVEHSQQLRDRFRAAGVSAEHLDGSTPLEQRRAILARVAAGTTRVLCNVGVAVEGLDIPRLKCVVLARPTKSLSRYLQSVGRGRRPWAECTCGHMWAPKPEDVICPRCSGRAWHRLVARIHDHAFCIKSHGLPDAERDYSLNAKPEAPPSLTQCQECLAMYAGTRCPACNAENEPAVLGERKLQTVAEAEQYEFTSSTEAAPDAPAVERSPTRVTWSTEGRVIEGKLLKTWTEPTSWGERNWYRIQTDKRVYDCPGTTDLDERMSRARVGDAVRVTYLGMPGGKKHRFKVEIDDGQPAPDCTCAVVARPPCGACSP